MIQEQFCWKLFLFPVAEGIAKSKKLLFLLMSDRPRLGFLWLDRKRMGWREVMNHATLHCTDRLKMYITGFMGVNPLPYFILILLSLLDWFCKHEFCSHQVNQQLMKLNSEVQKYQQFIKMLNN